MRDCRGSLWFGFFVRVVVFVERRVDVIDVVAALGQVGLAQENVLVQRNLIQQLASAEKTRAVVNEFQRRHRISAGAVTRQIRKTGHAV